MKTYTDCRQVLCLLVVAIPALMLLSAMGIMLHAAFFNQRLTFLQEIGYWDVIAWGFVLQITCVVCLLVLELWHRLRGRPNRQ